MRQESFMYLFILAFLLIATPVIVAVPSQQAGICYGTLGDIPSPRQAVSLIEGCGIAKFRIYEPQPEILRQKSRLVSLTIRNQDLAGLAASPDAARAWVNQNYVPYSNIYEIVVGNEVVPSENAQYVARAMQNIRAAVSQTDEPDTVVTTSISGEALANTSPPSQSVFTQESIGAMTEIVQVLHSDSWPSWSKKLYVSVYPYFAYASDPAHISREFATFQSTEPVLVDVGGLAYKNLFDAMFDSFVWALEKVGGGDVELTVGETGWPSAGNGELTTPALASTYVTNAYNHLVDNRGTPKRPNDGFSDFFVFALFNENHKPEGVEQNWGLFDRNMQHVYSSPLC